jgi:hypothetical protein
LPITYLNFLPDVNPSRLEFAKNYAATEIFATPNMLPQECTTAYGKRTVKGWNKPQRGPDAVSCSIYRMPYIETEFELMCCPGIRWT